LNPGTSDVSIHPILTFLTRRRYDERNFSDSGWPKLKTPTKICRGGNVTTTTATSINVVTKMSSIIVVTTMSLKNDVTTTTTFTLIDNAAFILET
jgi:hypothetical protein